MASERERITHYRYRHANHNHISSKICHGICQLVLKHFYAMLHFVENPVPNARYERSTLEKETEEECECPETCEPDHDRAE